MVEPSEHREYRSLLLRKVPRVSDIVSFHLQKPRGYGFEAGQWFVITLEPGGLVTHHFSHSNGPHEDVLEFTTRLRGTEFKNALARLPLGAPITVEGPYGAFTLTEVHEPVVFLAGGIGITCVRGILRTLAAQGQDAATGTPPGGKAEPLAGPPEIVLFFANQSESAIPFRDELEALGPRLPGFRVLHVISRPGDAWSGHCGHIDESALESELPNLREWRYYVSGPPSFDASMTEVLTGLGVGPERIRAERFEGY